MLQNRCRCLETIKYLIGAKNKSERCQREISGHINGRLMLSPSDAWVVNGRGLVAITRTTRTSLLTQSPWFISEYLTWRKWDKNKHVTSHQTLLHPLIHRCATVICCTEPDAACVIICFLMIAPGTHWHNDGFHRLWLFFSCHLKAVEVEF